MITVSGKLQPSAGRTNNAPGPSGMKIWVTLPGKEPCPSELPGECEGNTEWIIEEE